MIPHDWTKLEGTDIHRVKFVKNEKDFLGKLLVEFRTGKVYSYKEVPAIKAENLVHITDPTKYFRNHIRGWYDTEKQ